MLTKEEALLKVDPDQLDQLLHRRIDPDAAVDVIAHRHRFSGAASGKIVFTADEAEALGQQASSAPGAYRNYLDDIHGMIVAQGILLPEVA